jgi:hypothetical protein
MSGVQIGPTRRRCSKGRGFNPPSQKNIEGLERNGAEKKKKRKKKELPLQKKDRKRTKVNCLRNASFFRRYAVFLLDLPDRGYDLLLQRLHTSYCDHIWFVFLTQDSLSTQQSSCNDKTYRHRDVYYTTCRVQVRSP